MINDITYKKSQELKGNFVTRLCKTHLSHQFSSGSSLMPYVIVGKLEMAADDQR